MSDISMCPECETQLFNNLKFCTCGWRLQIQEKLKQPDHLCQYIENGIRCSEIGTVSPWIKKIGVWFCLKHESQIK